MLSLLLLLLLTQLSIRVPKLTWLAQIELQLNNNNENDNNKVVEAN